MTYAKALTALLTGLATWGATAGADGHYSPPELWGVLAVVASALAVYAVPHPPQAEKRHRRATEKSPAETDTPSETVRKGSGRKGAPRHTS